jgi:hypothetical protein
LISGYFWLAHYWAYFHWTGVIEDHHHPWCSLAIGWKFYMPLQKRRRSARSPPLHNCRLGDYYIPGHIITCMQYKFSKDRSS